MGGPAQASPGKPLALVHRALRSLASLLQEGVCIWEMWSEQEASWDGERHGYSKGRNVWKRRLRDRARADLGKTRVHQKNRAGSWMRNGLVQWLCWGAVACFGPVSKVPNVGPLRTQQRIGTAVMA